MLFSTSAIAVTLLSTVSLTSAHFSVTYPYWRGDSFETQWEYPCGGVDQSKSHTNRTAWPLDGGALVFNPSHDHAQTYVNMGLGNNVTRLNIPLVAAFNQTGKGVFCFPKLTIPADARANITEGVNATIQIIQLGSTGSALYNCADVTFKAEAESPGSDICFNSTDVGEAPFTYPSVPQAQTPDAGSGASLSSDSKGAIVAVIMAATFAGLLL